MYIQKMNGAYTADLDRAIRHTTYDNLKKLRPAKSNVIALKNKLNFLSNNNIFLTKILKFQFSILEDKSIRNCLKMLLIY